MRSDKERSRPQAAVSLYRLEIEGGRLVAGFGRASQLSATDFRDLAGE